METKPLKSDSTDSLVSRIRRTKNRMVTFHKPVIKHVEGKANVLSLFSGRTPLGVVTTNTQQEANRLISSKEVSIRIGWDSNRNEKILADFVY